MSTSPRKTLRHLRQLADAITSEIDSPNYGGCCVIASRVAERLLALGVEAECITSRERLGEACNAPANVRHLIDDPSDMLEWEDNGVTFCHVAVRFRLNGRVYTWDSDTGPLARVTLFGHRYRAYAWGLGMTADEARAVADRPDGWNSDFDRAQIPHIEALVAKFLN